MRGRANLRTRTIDGKSKNSDNRSLLAAFCGGDRAKMAAPDNDQEGALLRQMERELFKDTGHDEAVQPLYHYTDAAGVLGIIRGKQIWATHFRYLNDQDELEAGERIITDEARRLAGERPEETARGWFLDSFAQIHPEQSLTHIADVFIASLSANGDQLSQWRAYGADGHGYSLGFRALPLPRDNPPNARVALIQMRCEYNEERFRQLAAETLTEVAKGFAKYVETYARDAGDVASMRAKAMVVALRRVAVLVPRFKHKAFAEEDEWRLVAIPMRAREHEAVKFRTTRHGLTPYVPIDLAQDGALIDIARVHLGPRHDAERAANTIETLLRHSGYAATGLVEKSTIPYRG